MSDEPKFSEGDKVLVNGGLVAEIVRYDELANVLVYKHNLPSGGTDSVYAHVSNTRLEPFTGQSADLHVDAPGDTTRDAVSNDSVIEPEPKAGKAKE